MGLRRVAFVADEYYHVYNRGNSKQLIFNDEADHERFLRLLYLCNSELHINFRDVIETHENVYEFERGKALVDIGAYCLMPNHFHLLVREKEEGHLSLFMKKLATAYVMYFNQKYERTGSLFEGKFKAEHADTDRYLKYLFAYIHLNPVALVEPKWKIQGIRDKKKAYEYALQYRYSSLDGEESAYVLNQSSFPRYFAHPQDYQKEIFQWLSSPRKDLGEL